MQSCVPCLCADGHGCGCEILHLLQVEVQLACDDGQLCHVFFPASGMAADEVRYDLLVKMLSLVDVVENLLESRKLRERRFPHQEQNSV